MPEKNRNEPHVLYVIAPFSVALGASVSRSDLASACVFVADWLRWKIALPAGKTMSANQVRPLIELKL